MNDFTMYLSKEQAERYEKLANPYDIQQFLDETPYSTEDINRTPLQVIQDGVAHCLDGALLAADALRRLGHPPLLVDMFPDPGLDDDHILAIYRCNGRYGAIAKSNFPGLRLREAVYRDIRELVMSYFELFFNFDGVKSLRTYTRMLSLKQFDSLNWTYQLAGVQAIEKRLLSLKRIPLLSQPMVDILFPADPLTLKVGTYGVNPAGLFKPGKAK
jgi:hypothetical protein